MSLRHTFAGELGSYGTIRVQTRDGAERTGIYTGHAIADEHGSLRFFRVRVGTPHVDARELWVSGDRHVEVDEPSAAPSVPDVFASISPEEVFVDDRFGRFANFCPALGPVIHYGGK